MLWIRYTPDTHAPTRWEIALEGTLATTCKFTTWQGDVSPHRKTLTPLAYTIPTYTTPTSFRAGAFRPRMKSRKNCVKHSNRRRVLLQRHPAVRTHTHVKRSNAINLTLCLVDNVVSTILSCSKVRRQHLTIATYRRTSTILGDS